MSAHAHCHGGGLKPRARYITICMLTGACACKGCLTRAASAQNGLLQDVLIQMPDWLGVSTRTSKTRAYELSVQARAHNKRQFPYTLLGHTLCRRCRLSSMLGSRSAAEATVTVWSLERKHHNMHAGRSTRMHRLSDSCCCCCTKRLATRCAHSTA